MPSFFYIDFCFLQYYCLILFIRGSFSKRLLLEFSYLIVIFGYFLESGVIHFCYRFSIVSIVNSAIVEIAKLNIFLMKFYLGLL